MHPIIPCRDTVGSVGLVPKHLPFSGSNNAILHFRHALALDEHRVKFIPFFCTTKIPKYRRTNSKVSEVVSENAHHSMKRQISEGSELEVELNEIAGAVTDVKEVFFAGVHCGTFWPLPTHQIRYLRMPFQMSGVDLSKTANATVLRASPFDG